MIRIKSAALNYLKGILVGFGAIIPGVSGGTAAIALGVFGGLLEAVANITKHFKRSVIYIMPIMAGAITGIYILSSPLAVFCDRYMLLSRIVFCIISIISAAFFVKRELLGRIRKSCFFWMALGVAVSYITDLSLMRLNEVCRGESIIYLLLCGIPLSLALVLPAISFSYMLLCFNLYEPTVKAIAQNDIGFLAPLLLGVCIGGFIFSKLLYKLTENYRPETYSFVLGFVIVSLINVFI